MQAARNLVAVLVELAARVQLRHDHFSSGNAFRLVNVGRNAAAIVGHRAGTIGVERHRHTVGMAGERFVDRVVDHFVDHVMQARAVIGIADVHAGALAHRIKALQNLDRVRIIGRHLLCLRAFSEPLEPLSNFAEACRHRHGKRVRRPPVFQTSGRPFPSSRLGFRVAPGLQKDPPGAANPDALQPRPTIAQVLLLPQLLLHVPAPKSARSAGLSARRWSIVRRALLGPVDDLKIAPVRTAQGAASASIDAGGP